MGNDMSVKKWVGTLFIIAIPIVNLIFLFMWAFGDDNPRKNYSKATLIVFSTFIGIALILGILGSIISLNYPQNQTNPQNETNSDFLQEQAEYQSQIKEKLNQDLEILDISIVEDKDGYKEVIGHIRNNSDTNSYSSFVIECNIYDNENSIIQTVEIVVDDSVPPGETLKFNEWSIHTDAVGVKAITLRGKSAFDF